MPDSVLQSSGSPIPAQDRREEKRRITDRDWPKLLGAVAILCAAAGLLAGTLGLRVWGPPQDVAALSTRVKSLEDGAQQTTARLGRLEDASRFQSYLVCVQLRRSDPTALPPDCTPIIQSRGAP